MLSRTDVVGLVAVSLLAGCGRIDYDPQGRAARDASAPPIDASSSLDAGEAGTPPCPAGTEEIDGLASRVCIDLAQSGSISYQQSAAACASAGKRLCSDAEWLAGCDQLSPAIATDMIDDWEWVADLASDGVARKRGAGSCAGMSTHEIYVDAYGYRCCLDL